MGKLKLSRIFAKKTAVKPTLTPDERTEEIDYLRGCFRLTFRVFDEEEYTDDNDVFDVQANDETNFNGASDADMQDFQARFAALDALDVFYQLCLDYYEEQMQVLKKQLPEYQIVLDLYLQSNPTDLAKMSKRARNDYETMFNYYSTRVKYNLRSQGEIQAKIATIKKQLTEIGVFVPTNEIDR